MAEYMIGGKQKNPILKICSELAGNTIKILPIQGKGGIYGRASFFFCIHKSSVYGATFTKV